MKKPKKLLTSEQIYKSNRKKAKRLKILAPIVFWILIVITLIFFYLTTKNSIGNVVEIIDLLDADTHTRVELQENYNMLKERWGEWILFGDEGTGISVKYINVGNALFSGLMITFGAITIISFFLE